MSLGRRVSIAMMVAATAGACASLQGPPEDVPPEAPSARQFRGMSPARRDLVLPPPQVFVGREYIERLVCGPIESPVSRPSGRAGAIETYSVECPGRGPVTVRLDTARDPPPAPAGLRLLEARAFESYREALGLMERQQLERALKAMDAALLKAPGEAVFRRERMVLLYMQERVAEALLEADDLIEAGLGSPYVYRYRALSARVLGMTGEVMKSIDGILLSGGRQHPLYAEAVCAKGMILAQDGDVLGEVFMHEGCSLDHQPCCDELEQRALSRARAQRAIEAARALSVTLPSGPEPTTPPVGSVPVPAELRAPTSPARPTKGDDSVSAEKSEKAERPSP